MTRENLDAALLLHDLRGVVQTLMIAWQLETQRGRACASPVFSRSLIRARDLIGELASAIGVAPALAHVSTTLDVNRICGNVVDSLSARAAERGMRLERHSCDSELLVAGEGMLIERAIENLVSNSLEHAAHDGGRVEIASNKRNGEAVVRVQDDGPGLPEEVVAHPENRIGPHPGRGWGLGLQVVMLAARLHGGRLEIDRALPRGASFTLVLPLAH
jgi:signal transduction histidine kinase